MELRVLVSILSGVRQCSRPEAQPGLINKHSFNFFMLILGGLISPSVCHAVHQQQQSVNELLLFNGANESCSSSSLNEINTKHRKKYRTANVVVVNYLKPDVCELRLNNKKNPQDSLILCLLMTQVSHLHTHTHTR